MDITFYFWWNHIPYRKIVRHPFPYIACGYIDQRRLHNYPIRQSVMYLFHCNGETGHARECLTLADELKEGGPQPEFFTEVVRYSISIMLDRAIRQSQEAHAREHGHDHEHDHGEAASQGGSEEESPVIISP